MSRTYPLRASAALAAASLAVSTVASAGPLHAGPRYEQVVSDVAQMVSDGRANELVRAKGLQLVNVMWEDTGRST
jgi:hypothetical protein